MLLADKIEYLQKNHWSDWVKTFKQVEQELSDRQTYFCLCGRLATGLHEMNCQKFLARLRRETVKRLSKFLAGAAAPVVCPACGGAMDREKELNALSRYADGVRICSGCGVREAFAGYFWEPK